jgi:hypothetical protein
MDDNDRPPGPTGDDDAISPPYRGWTQAPTEEVYTGMWARYRDGLRDPTPLAKRCGVAYATAYTAVYRGWPEEHWPALKERLELWDRQRKATRDRELREADAKTAAAYGKNEGQIWLEFRQRAQHLVADAESVLTVMGKKLKDAVEMSTFVKYRRVRQLDKNGVLQTVDQAYVDGLALAKAAALWTGSIKDMPQVMKFLLGDKALELPEAAPDFTAEQLEQMARGELPEGVSEKQVGLALMAAAAKASAGE